MTASLRVCGMCPHTKEALTIFSSGVPITGNSSFKSFVGIGSRRQVEDFEEFTMVLNSMRSIDFKWATHPSEDSASIWVDGRVDPTWGVVEELWIVSLIFIILSSKKLIKSLLLNAMDTQGSTWFLDFYFKKDDRLAKEFDVLCYSFYGSFPGIERSTWVWLALSQNRELWQNR